MHCLSHLQQVGELREFCRNVGAFADEQEALVAEVCKFFVEELASMLLDFVTALLIGRCQV